MEKKEREAMREGFDLCMTEILRQREVIGKLVSYLHVELGTQAAQELLKDLKDSDKIKE